MSEERKPLFSNEVLVVVILAIISGVAYYFTGYAKVQNNYNEIVHLKEWKINHISRDKELRTLVQDIKDWKLKNYSVFTSETKGSLDELNKKVDELDRLTKSNFEDLRDYISMSNMRETRQ